MSGEVLAGWRTVELAHIAKLSMGETLLSKNLTGDGIPVFSANTDNGPWGFTSNNRRRLRRGDIVVGARGSIGFPRRPDFDVFTCTQTTIAVEPDCEVVDSGYLHHALCATDILGIASQQAVPMLTIGSLSPLAVPLPPLEEQRRIAEVLRSVDEAIVTSLRTLSQMSAAKIAERREAFSALAAPVLPLSLEKQGWSRTRLGKIFVERKEKGIAGLPVASVSIEQGLVLRADLDRRVASNLPPEGHSLVRRNDIAYNMMRMWQGACGVATADCLVSPAYVVMAPKPDLDPRFAHHLLRSEPVIALLHAYSQGIVDDRLRLYPQAFGQIPINIPPLVIQREIAELLDGYADCEAAAAKDLASKVAMKASLMSDLLSGRVRVPA